MTISMMTTQTPTEEEIQALAIIQAFADFLQLSREPVPIEKLKGGLSQTFLCKFTLHGLKYVLRLFKPELHQIDRLRQITNAQAAGRLGVGPKLFFCDKDHAGYVMEYLPGRTAKRTDWKDAANLSTLANQLGRLHESRYPFAEARSPFHAFHRSFTKGKLQGTAYPKALHEVALLMLEIEGLLQLLALPKVPSHLDLNALNILLGKDSLHFVDWEVAGLADPYFDLSMLPLFLRLQAQEEERFLTSYFGHAPTEEIWNRYLIAQPIALILRATIFLSIGAGAETSEEYDAELASGSIYTLHELMQGHEDGCLNLPRWKIGLSLLKASLELIDSAAFKRAVASCQKQAQLPFGNLKFPT